MFYSYPNLSLKCPTVEKCSNLERQPQTEKRIIFLYRRGESSRHRLVKLRPGAGQRLAGKVDGGGGTSLASTCLQNLIRLDRKRGMRENININLFIKLCRKTTNSK